MAEGSSGSGYETGGLSDHLSEFIAQAPIDREDIPNDTLDVLKGLSPEELDVLARVRASLKRAGVSDKVKAQIV
jgi:hypothetical protein